MTVMRYLDILVGFLSGLTRLDESPEGGVLEVIDMC
jgi:hypothetical protein